MKYLFVVIFMSIFLSCSDDDDQHFCTATEFFASMEINGEYYEFYPGGRGIDLMTNGKYDLGLNIRHYNNLPYSEHGVRIESILGERGENEIDRFFIRFRNDSVNFEGDLVNGDFQNMVTSNNNNCFEATFSGRLTIDGQTLTIENGNLNFVYEDPFEDTHID